MMDWRKNSTLFCCILTSVLLGGFVCCSKAQVVITPPPENTTVCRGSDVTISCGYGSATALPVTWIINGTSFTQEEIVNGTLYQLNNPSSPMRYSLTVFSINGTTTFQCIVLSTPTTNSTSGTVTVTDELTPIMITANVSFKVSTVMITVSWQTITGCVANIMIYNITVMDQYSPAIVTVPANMSSVEISQFPDNGTSIVANREYTISVSALSDEGTSYPSDPVDVGTFILQNCDVKSLVTGTVRVSCDSSHQLLVTLTCINSCTNPTLTSNGSSPFIVRGLDPGIMYSVIINVFDGNQVVLSDQTVMTTITVMSDPPETSICDVISPSIGTIRVSCNSSYQIYVTVLCSDCNNPLVTNNNGSSPLTVTGLHPGRRYSVIINVMDGNQMVHKEIKQITVINTVLSASSLSPTTASSLSSSTTTASSSSKTTTATLSTISVSSSSTTSFSSTTTSLASSPLPPANSDSAGGDNSGGAIAGGVIGGIVVVIIIIIIIIVICYFIFYKNKGKGSTNDDRTKLKSPPGTGGTHASEGDTNVTTDSSAQYDKVVYAAPVQTVNIPHQAAVSGEQYAVSTKTVNKTSEQQLPQEHVHAPDTKKDFQGVTYADLQVLPSTDSGNKRFSNPHPASAYAELLM